MKANAFAIGQIFYVSSVKTHIGISTNEYSYGLNPRHLWSAFQILHTLQMGCSSILVSPMELGTFQCGASLMMLVALKTLESLHSSH